MMLVRPECNGTVLKCPYIRDILKIRSKLTLLMKVLFIVILSNCVSPCRATLPNVTESLIFGIRHVIKMQANFLVVERYQKSFTDVSKMCSIFFVGQQTKDNRVCIKDLCYHII